MSRLSARFTLLMAATALVPLLAYGVTSVAIAQGLAEQAAAQGRHPSPALRMAALGDVAIGPDGTLIHAGGAAFAPVGASARAADPALALANALQRQLALATTVALVAVLALGAYWNRRVHRPIVRLARDAGTAMSVWAARAGAAGRADDIERLTAAVNHMADRLLVLEEDGRRKDAQVTLGRKALELAHDMSSPIQNLRNSCALLVARADDPAGRDTLTRTLDREFAQVKRVLDDLRALARATARDEAHAYRSGPVDVNVAIGEVVDSARCSADAAGVRLIAELARGPLRIDADAFALSRVCRNLIANALEATPACGRIVVRTRRLHGRVVVEVEDSGCGIPASRLSTLFDGTTTTRPDGLGLGLALSKRIVEQAGGSVDAISEPGAGSTFTLRFPMREETRPAAAAPELGREHPARRGAGSEGGGLAAGAARPATSSAAPCP